MGKLQRGKDWISGIFRRLFIGRFFPFLEVVAIVVFIALFFLIAWVLWNPVPIGCFLGKGGTRFELLTFLGTALGGTILLFNAIAIQQRADAQMKIAGAQAETAQASVQANEQTLFDQGIQKLGSDSESVRLGGIYTLFEMAIAKPERRRNIMQILSAHLRKNPK